MASVFPLNLELYYLLSLLVGGDNTELPKAGVVEKGFSCCRVICHDLSTHVSLSKYKPKGFSLVPYD